MGDYEQLLDRLREEGLDELAGEFGKFAATELRKKAQERDSFEKKNQELEQEVQVLKTRPKIESAFRAQGVDYDALRPAEVKVLEGLKPEGDITDEWVAQQIQEYGFPTTDTPGGSSAGTPNAAAVVAQAVSAPTGTRNAASLTPEKANEWAIDKKIAFSKEHPEAWESLKRGETVTGIAF